MDKEELKELIRKVAPESEFAEGTQQTEIIAPAEKLVALVSELKSNQHTLFDYLINHTAVDYPTHIMLVYHLDSTKHRHLLVVKVKIEDRENPVVESISGIYPTAEFFEREVFDLFGVRYNNHPNLKRLFMEDDYGFPLRKDFRDEVNIIER